MKNVSVGSGAIVSSRGISTKWKKSQALSLAVMAVPIGLAFVPSSAKAITTYTWTAGDTTGSWNSTSTTTDWKSATYPNAAGIITQYTSGAGTTALNVNVSDGELYCSGGSGANWTINGTANTITMDGTGFASNNAFTDSNSAIYFASGANNFTVNSNLALANTDLDVGSNNTGLTGGVIIGTVGTTTILNSGSSLRTINILKGDKSGNNDYNVIFNSAIGTSGGAIAINDASVTGNVSFEGAIGSSVTNVTIGQSAGTRAFFGNTGNAFTGNLTVNTGSILELEQKYTVTVAGQVIPYGASASNVVDNGLIDLNGNSQQMNGLTGTGNINISNWDGATGGVTDTLTLGNNNASATYGGTLGVGNYASTRVLDLAKVGTGTQVFNNSGNLLGAVTVSAGTLQIGDGSNATATVGVLFGTTTPTSVTDNANLAFDYNGAATAGNTITGTGTVTQIGTAALTLSGAASTFSGGLNINSSSVIAGNANAGVLGSGTITMAASTTLDINGNSPTTGLLSASTSSPVVTNNGSANGVLTISGTGSATFAGVIQSGSSGTLGLTKSGAGTQTLTGSSTYTGATTINAGKLILTSTAGLGNTAITVNPGGTFSAHPGSGIVTVGSAGTGTLGASLNLAPGTGTSAGGVFDMLDNTIGTVNLDQQSGFSGTALTLGGSGTSTNAPVLDFELSSSAADQLNISTGSVTVGSTSADVIISVLSGTTSLTAGNYVLINAPGGGLTPLTLSANSIVLGTQSYSFSLGNSTLTQEILTVGTSGGAPVTAYYTGANGTSWSATGPTNFATNSSGATATSVIPGGGSNVFFTATGANSANFSTTLDGAFNINSLSFTGVGTPAATTSVTIAAGSGGSLTLTPTNSFQDSSGNTYGPGTGLVVQAGSAAHTISAPVTLGASQTWEIDNAAANPLTVSNTISDGGFGYTLNKTGVGSLVLSGVNTYTGGTNVSAGTLTPTVSGALPVNGPLTVNGGTVDLYGIAQTIGALSDGGVSTGSIVNSQAATTLTSNSSSTSTYSGGLTLAGNTLAVIGTGSQTLGGTNTLATLTQSAGTLNLNGATSFTASVQPNGGTMVLGSASSLNGLGTGALQVGDNGNLTDNGGAITVASFTTNSKGTSATIINNSTVVISGALSVDADNGSSGASYLQLAGGSLTAGSITVGRTGYNSGIGTIVFAGPSNEGFYISSGTVSTGSLSLGTNSATNSNADVKMDTGTFNVSGATIITGNTTRNSTLDIAGGTFTTSTAQIGGNFTGSAGEFLIRGTGIANVGTITFGNATQTSGADILELIGGTLYLGAGGMVNASSGVTPTINIGGTSNATGAIFAASAPQSLAFNMTLTNSSAGIAPTFQAANASGGAENIAVTGFLTGAGGLTKTGAGVLTLTAGNSYTGVTNFSAGTVNINGQFALGGAVYGGAIFNGGTLQYATGSIAANTNGTGDITQNSLGVAKTVTINSGGATIDTNGNTVTFADAVSGTGPLTLLDTNGAPGSLTLAGVNTYTGLTTVGAGATLNVNGSLAATGGVTTSGTVNFGANNASGTFYTRTKGQLTINSGGVINILPAISQGTRTLLNASGLSIAGTTGAWTGKLDLSDNDMIVQGGSLTNLTNQVKQGFNGGTWAGPNGIVSSTAAADGTHLTAVGVIQNSTAMTFDGATSTATDVLLKYTYYGDANLDGKVDGSDYSRIDSSYLSESSGGPAVSGWYNGDFNYDGVVDGSDYTLIDNAFNSQGTSLAAEVASPLATATAEIAGNSSVPEPTTLGLLGIGAAGLLGRRRRHSSTRLAGAN